MRLASLRWRMVPTVAAAAAFMAWTRLCAEPATVAPVPTSPAPSNASVDKPPAGDSSPAIRELPDGNVQVNGVLVDRKLRSVQFPASINMDRGPLEYALVGAEGKVHESLLATAIPANDIHIAMLLLGAKGMGEKAALAPAPSSLDKAYLQHAPKLDGDTVAVTISWKSADGKTQSVPLSALLALEGKPVPEKLRWFYSGSLIVEDGFLAQRLSMMIALLPDPGALVNLALPAGFSGDNWEASKKCPKAGTAVTVEMRMVPRR